MSATSGLGPGPASGSNPVCTVVIPTYNRRKRLQRMLDAMAAQVLDVAFEIVVVSDGSTDSTEEYLSTIDLSVPLHYATQPNSGPAAARNRGVEMAVGELIIFVDDDVLPTDGMLQAHVDAHRRLGDDYVVIGPMLDPPDFDMSPWTRWEQAMLRKQYRAMDDGEYPATSRQFYTGNASLLRRHLIDVGGFDPRFRRAEDVELAYRLEDHGLEFFYENRAVGHHYAERSFESWKTTAYVYGRNDVIFGRDPNRAWMMSFMAYKFNDQHPLARWATAACIRVPRLRPAANTVLRGVTAGSERVGLHALSRYALSGIFSIEFHSGIADELGGSRPFFELLEARPAPNPSCEDPTMTDHTSAERPHVGFVLEQTLGHVTHSKNLQSLIPRHDKVRTTFVPVEYDTTGRLGRLPPWSNWTVRAGVRARCGIRSLHRHDPVDALFVHTQVPAVLLPDVLARIPAIVSIDATPMQYDELGEHYAHDVGTARVEQLKWRLNRDCFRRAAHLVAWSEWAKASLVEQYDVAADKVSVLAPGVDPSSWTRPDGGPGRDGATTRFLFVGGDLERKGGGDLLAAFAALRAERIDPSDVELHLVTGARIDAPPGVTVHNGVTPNSPELIGLYHLCDVFCLPTLGDCLPMVLSEAGAAGLASISTDVGAIREIVIDEHTGLLVPVSDSVALHEAMRRLTEDAALRQRLGQQAIEHVHQRFDADHNAGALVDLLHHVAVTRRSR